MRSFQKGSFIMKKFMMTMLLLAGLAVPALAIPAMAEEMTVDGQCKLLSEVQVKGIQSALAERSIYTGDIDGKWDAETLEAVQTYQSSRGLNPNGILKTSDFEDMGLDASLYEVKEYTTTTIEHGIDIRKHGNGPKAVGKQAFQE